jgi:hypothetical protein
MPQTKYSYSGGNPAVLDMPYTGNGRTELSSILIGNSTSPEFNLYMQYIWDPTDTTTYTEDSYYSPATGYVPKFGDGVYDRSPYDVICETYLVTMIEVSYK